MANLKLIVVTGSPFTTASMGCIGIQRSDNSFDIIMGGSLFEQTSSNGQGYRLATQADLKIHWSTIYPYWTPEPGDSVIITQNYTDWFNKEAFIVETCSPKDYWKVKRGDGLTNSFDYTCQMILVPHGITPIHESKPEPEIKKISWNWKDLNIGDKVKITRQTTSLRCIGTIHTISRMEPLTYEGDQPIQTKGINGDSTGWPLIDSFEPYHEPEIKEIKKESMNEFKIGDHVKSICFGNKAYGKIGVIKVIQDCSLGVEFSEDIVGHHIDGHGKPGHCWFFSIDKLKLVAKPTPARKFNIGDKVTYKSHLELGRRYEFGGEDQRDFVGKVINILEYVEYHNCYKILVTTINTSVEYSMLESEFKEYDSGYVPITSGAIGSSEPATRLVIKGSSAAADGNNIFVNGIVYSVRTYSSDGPTHSTIATIDTDPLSLYKQKPITIKAKPKSKLTTI
jgi:hypothetical protein